jgi:hypothetical protein
MSFVIKRIKFFSIGLICIMALQSTPLIGVCAQDTQGEEMVVLAEGVALDLVTAQELSSKVAKPGDPVSFKVDEDVVVGGHVVISKGTLAQGSVINAEKSGRMGKAGKLGIQIESTTTVDGQPLKLRAARGKEGDDKTNSTAALTILVSSLFLFRKGGEATIKEGTKVKVFVAEEKRFRVSGSSLVAVNTPDSNAASNAGEMVTVYIYRPDKLLGKALEPSVFCDGVELGRMDNGRYMTLKLKPGKHIVHMTDKKKGFDINMGAGQLYYFRVGIEMGMWKGQGKLMLKEAEEGAAEIKKLKPLDASKIKDHTMVVVEQNNPTSD